MKGTEMSVARVTMVDYIGEKADDKFVAVYREICPQNASRSRWVNIGAHQRATSGFSIAICKTAALAKEMLPTRAKMLEQCLSCIKDMFHLEGPADLHYLNELMNAPKKYTYKLMNSLGD